jgi:Protein of unknown function (DUF1569)
MIDTTKVHGRRALRFDSLEQVLVDSRACVAAGAAGGLERLGNWTIGQALNHLAAWIDYPLLGYPPELEFPEAIKVQARAAKARILREAMQPGERLPLEGLAGASGTLATEDVPADVGLARLESAVARLRSGRPHDPTPLPDPAFGVITHDEWTQMNLRHAELHLSFFVPR